MRNKPLLKMPSNIREFEFAKGLAEENIKQSLERERLLKIQYREETKEREKNIRELRAKVNTSIKELSRFQRENRSIRSRLARQRRQLSYDLSNLNNRYAYFVRHQREKVLESPGQVINRMHEGKLDPWEVRHEH
jgi:hypothetical protein